MKSPLRWIGGKHKLYNKIIEVMPKHTCYVEPFAGGVWVLLNKPKSSVEVINDINGELINFYNVIQRDYTKLKEEFNFMVPSRKVFDKYAKMNKQDIIGMSNIERAVRFLYINRCSHSGRMQNFGYSNSRRSTLCCLTDDFDSIVDKLHARLKDVYLECGDYTELIKRYDKRNNTKEEQNVIFYFDPPYHNTYDYNGHAIDYHEFADKLHEMNSNWMITVNDDELTRKLFNKYHKIQLAVKETIHNSGKNVKTRNELLIINFNLENVPDWVNIICDEV